jgi:hypothetical protein
VHVYIQYLLCLVERFLGTILCLIQNTGSVGISGQSFSISEMKNFIFNSVDNGVMAYIIQKNLVFLILKYSKMVVMFYGEILFLSRHPCQFLVGITVHK